MTKDLLGREITDLERDYRELIAALTERDTAPEELLCLREHQRFVERSSHHLADVPSALWSLAHAEPQASVVRQSALTFEANGQKRGQPWFRLLNVPVHAPDAARVRTLVGHTSMVWAVAIAPDGWHALSGGLDKTLIWWDLNTGQPVRTLQGHTAHVLAVAIAPDGRHALSGSGDNTLIWWDLSTGQAVHALQGHTNSVLSVVITHDGCYALSASWDKTVIWWDLRSKECLVRYPCPHKVRSVALGCDDHTLAVGLADGRVLFFRLEET